MHYLRLLLFPSSFGVVVGLIKSQAFVWTRTTSARAISRGFLTRSVLKIQFPLLQLRLRRFNPRCRLVHVSEMSRRWREGVKWRQDNGKIVCTESFQLLGGRTVRLSNGLSPAVPCSEFNKRYANCDSLPSVKLHLESSSSSDPRSSCRKIICTFADRRRKREQEIDLDFASRAGSLIPKT